tara:strand:+ start:474 stop:1994 length:1521 start_codon:yes stop_codon:yes gene_type:complete
MSVAVQYTFGKELEDKLFGCARLSIESQIKPTYKKMHIVFSLDRSGSMSDTGRDERSKLEHAIHTLLNSIDFLVQSYKNVKEPVTILVSVLAFDHDVEEIGLYVNILNSTECYLLKQQIKELEPRGCTDIGRVLYKVKAGLETTTEIYGEEMERVHIFMTDGHPTEGITEIDDLVDLVDSSYRNVFIGYGTDHNYKLLKNMGDLKNGSNYFAESYERAGMVYGEILQNVLFAYPTSISLSLTRSGEVYDPKSNCWVEKLEVENIAFGDTKTFNLRAEKEDNPMVSYLIGEGTTNITLDWGTNVDPTSDSCSNELNYHGLEEAYLRQRVLEYLAKCLLVTENSSRKELRTCGRELLQELKGLSEKPEWKQSRLLRQLQDDIYVGLKSLDCYNGSMYAGARLQSLGSQRGYNVCELDGMTPRVPAVSSAAVSSPMRRIASHRFGNMVPSLPLSSSSPNPADVVETDDVGASDSPVLVLPEHQMSDRADSCFASPFAAVAMRQCSQPRD